MSRWLGEGRDPALQRRRRVVEDEALLRSLHETLQQTSICGLGQVALGPVLSILDRFPEVARATDGD